MVMSPKSTVLSFRGPCINELHFLSAARLETFMFDNVPMDRVGLKNTRLSNLEYLGADMVEAGNEFGPGTPYGSALIRVGQTQQVRN
jgi:hypothetical protein